MTTLHDITCPFCSLLCDDLSVQARQRRLQVVNHGCVLAARGFKQAPPGAQAYAHQQPVSHTEAVKHAAILLKKSRRPLIADLGTDINGLRAALHLAELTNAVIRHKYEDSTLHNLNVMQTGGGMMTTFAELKNRADVVVFIGDKITTKYPRLLDRFITTRQAQFLPKGQRRKLICIGQASRQEKIKLGESLLHIPATGNGLLNLLTLLKCTLLGQRGTDQNIAREKLKKLKQASALIQAAHYPVFIWSAAALPADSADLLIRTITDLIAKLNQRQRAAGLALTDNNAGGSLQQVATWQTGFPAGLRFTDGFPDSQPDPYTPYPAECDALVWISSLERDTPPTLDVPGIIISNNQAVRKGATIYLPVGTPGIDHAGNLFRADAVINLPLKKLRDSELYSTGAVLKQIIARLQAISGC